MGGYFDRKLGRETFEHDALRLKSTTSGRTVPDPLITRDIHPEAPDTFDIGTSNLLFRKIWASEIEAIIFAQNQVTLIGGWLFISKGEGTVNEDVNDSETEIDFGVGAGIQANDFLLFRGVGTVEYMQATSVIGGNVWNVTRDLDGSGANAWPLGTPYANLGYNGDGRIELNAYDTPRVQLIKQGTSYNVQTEMMRFGDLNGNWGYSSEQYGIALGEYTNNEANITIESTNGIRLREHSVTKIRIQPDGDVFIGSNIASPSTTHLAIFTNAQTYNTESVGAGDMLIGDNSAGHANIFWDTSAGKLKFRGGQTMQCEIGTDGKLLAGGGVVALDSSGVIITVTSGYSDTRSYQFANSGSTIIGRVGAFQDVGGPGNDTMGCQLLSTGQTGYDNYSGVRASAAATKTATAQLYAYYDGTYYCHIRAVAESAAAWGYCSRGFHVGGSADPGNDNLRVDGEIRQGATDYGAYEIQTSGQIYANSYIIAMGGLHVGGTADPGEDNLAVDGNAYITGYAYTMGGIHVGNTSDPGDDNLFVDLDTRIGGGLYVGSTGTDPDADDIHFDGNLKSVKSATHDVYAFKPLAAPLTNTSFDGDSFSTVGASTIIQNTSWSSTIPTEAKALAIQVGIRDEGSAGADCWFSVGPTSGYYYAVTCSASGAVADTSDFAHAVCPCTNGDIYYRCLATGAGTLDVWLRVWGYWI